MELIMPWTKDNYSTGTTDISKSAMLELWRCLHRYNKGMTLIGGWAPYFILERDGGSQYQRDHIGSKDIDIALNNKIISEAEYANIEQRVVELGYHHKLDQENKPIPFVFIKDYQVSKELVIPIEVDFVGTYYGNDGHRHQRISGIMARKCHGVDIVFDNYFEEELEGTFPSGGVTKEKIRIANLISSLTMKGIVIGERYKEKDAYDIYFLVTFFQGGPKEAATVMQKYLEYPLVNESLTSIRENFKTKDSPGPTWVADFLNETEGEPRAKRLTEVFMNVGEFLNFCK